MSLCFKSSCVSLKLNESRHIFYLCGKSSHVGIRKTWFLTLAQLLELSVSSPTTTHFTFSSVKGERLHKEREKWNRWFVRTPPALPLLG